METENNKISGYSFENDQEPPHIVEEPMSVYLSRQASQPVLAWRALGGNRFARQVPESSFDFYLIGEKGIPKSSVHALAEMLGIPMVAMADLLNVSYKTLGRKKDDELLDGWISSHSIEIAQTLARGLALFEDQEKLKRWLNKPNRALKGKIPLELLKYPTGIKLVNQMMGRLEEGVYT